MVLLPDPCYPVFAAGSKLGGAVPYYYPLVAEHDFLPYVKNIPEDVARKARYMVVSLPSNPVGSIATPGLYEEIVAFAKSIEVKKPMNYVEKAVSKSIAKIIESFNDRADMIVI